MKLRRPGALLSAPLALAARVFIFPPDHDFHPTPPQLLLESKYHQITHNASESDTTWANKLTRILHRKPFAFEVCTWNAELRPFDSYLHYDRSGDYEATQLDRSDSMTDVKKGMVFDSRSGESRYCF